MPTPLDVLDLIEAEPGKLEKRRLMKEHESDDLKKLLVYAVSPYVNFGFATLPEIVTEPPTPEGVSMTEFLRIAELLRTRQLTGHIAKDTLQAMLSSSTYQQRKWFGRIITKNLRAGVDSAVNDVWPGLILEFKPQLAEKWNEFYDKPSLRAKHCQFP